ncbi:MAG TPA: hypothetical protein VF796_28825 [Humisphaera sp.]
MPSTLPDVDAVEVVVMRGVESGPHGYMPNARDARAVRVQGPEAARIASLWRALPPGEQMRCHVPPFGLRFLHGGRVLVEASVCWQCNNVWGHAGDDRFGYEFDGSHPTARALLAACERTTGVSATG